MAVSSMVSPAMWSCISKPHTARGGAARVHARMMPAIAKWGAAWWTMHAVRGSAARVHARMMPAIAMWDAAWWTMHAVSTCMSRRHAV